MLRTVRSRLIETKNKGVWKTWSSKRIRMILDASFNNFVPFPIIKLLYPVMIPFRKFSTITKRTLIDKII